MAVMGKRVIVLNKTSPSMPIVKMLETDDQVIKVSCVDSYNHGNLRDPHTDGTIFYLACEQGDGYLFNTANGCWVKIKLAPGSLLRENSGRIQNHIVKVKDMVSSSKLMINPDTFGLQSIDKIE
jgi:hypothetical protein